LTASKETGSFAPAPLNDLLFTTREDWSPSDVDRLSFRYSLEREDDVSASILLRSIGSASQRQSSRNHTHSFSTNYTRTLTPRDVNSFSFSFGSFFNRTQPVTSVPQLTFPSIQQVYGLLQEIEADLRYYFTEADVDKKGINRSW